MSSPSTSPNLVPSHASHNPPSTTLLSDDYNSIHSAIKYIRVPAATVVADEFTVFTIHVVEKRFQRSLGSEAELVSTPVGGDTWTVMKRYSSMRAFHRKIRKSFLHTRRSATSGKRKEDNEPNSEEFQLPLPPFPPTKWFGNRAPKFVEQRREGLSKYWDALIQWSEVGQTADLRKRLVREYLTFSDPEIALHRMFQGMQHGPVLRPFASEQSQSGGVSSKEADDGRIGSGDTK